MIVLIAIAISVVAIPLRGWMIHTMWGWFVVPVFHLPALGIAQAAGLSLIVSILTMHPTVVEDEENLPKQVGHMVGLSLVAPLLFLAYGWVITKFL